MNRNCCPLTVSIKAATKIFRHTETDWTVERIEHIQTAVLYTIKFILAYWDVQYGSEVDRGILQARVCNMTHLSRGILHFEACSMALKKVEAYDMLEYAIGLI